MNEQETDLHPIAHERVALGAAALDETHADWINVVDYTTLDMGDASHDIIGQIFGNYRLDRNKVARKIDPENAHLYTGGERSGDSPDLPVSVLMARYGFTIMFDDDEAVTDSEGVDYDDLTAAWCYEIRERLEVAEVEQYAEEPATI